MAEIYIHMNNPDAAEKIYRQIILIQPEIKNSILKMIDCITYARNNPLKKEFLELFTGDYKFEGIEQTLTFFLHNNHLIAKARNQFPIFNYPVSDSQLISINGTAIFTFVKNNQGKVIRTLLNQNNTDVGILWKEDSLILDAKYLLDEGNNEDALSVFRDAYSKNPDHEYLADFIKHLEYVLGNDYKKDKPVMDVYPGKYGNKTIFRENDIFFYTDNGVFIYKILPLSADQFISPSFYDRTFRIAKDKNKINGLEILYRDGKREFFSRTD
jgi:tetratricopeptide (TPR) repeat protein